MTTPAKVQVAIVECEQPFGEIVAPPYPGEFAGTDWLVVYHKGENDVLDIRPGQVLAVFDAAAYERVREAYSDFPALPLEWEDAAVRDFGAEVVRWHQKHHDALALLPPLPEATDAA